MKYLKQFISASSFPVFATFFYLFNKVKKGDVYYKYTLIAPIWLGLWNVLSFMFAEHFNISMKTRFFITSLLSYLVVISYSTINNFYDFNNKEWIKYYLIMFFLYMFTWNIVIYNIEKYISL